MTRLRVAVVVASHGRPEALANLARHLARQTHPPHRLILSVTAAADLPDPLPATATVLAGPPGACAQRNRGLEAALPDSDVIAFLDDDYVPSARALAGIAAFFVANPGHVGANGRLIADGINTAGIPFAEAARLVAAHDATAAAPDPAPTRDLHGLYGCHMAFRAAAIGTTRFDERLPLLGWQEDIDFAARLRARGRLAATHAFAGVHCGIKSARAPGLPTGYAQVANPIYLARKGTMRAAYALRLVAGNLAANHARLLGPEPWIDRRGRARGNRLALRHALLGTLDPAHILKL